MSFGFGFGFPRRAAAGGAAPSLNFDFTSLTSLPSRITFSRTSNATLTDSNGRVAYAPHNLVTNSEDFEASAWQKTEAAVTANTGAAPDGTATADTLTSTATSNPNVHQSIAGPQTGIPMIFSVWVQGVTSTECLLSLYVNSGTPSPNVPCTGGVASGSATIDSSQASSGLIRFTGLSTTSWTRLYVVGTATATAGNFAAYIKNRLTGGAIGDSIRIWGAQLNVANAPVNLLTFSEQFDNAVWTKTNATVSANVVAAPDGTLTADKLVEDTATGDHRTFQGFSVPATGIPYTYTLYAKAAERTRVQMTSATGVVLDAVFDLSAGAVVTNTNGTASIVNVGSGWYRCAITGTSTAAVGTNLQARLIQSGTTNSYTGDGTSGVFIWGAQLNTGSTALPYVATTSSIYLPPSYNSTTPKNLLGFTQEFDNAAWTKSNSFVQTNLLTYSNFGGAVAGSPGTAPTAWSIFGTGTLAVSSLDGTNNSLSLAAVGAQYFLFQTFTANINTTYTVSAYVESNTGLSAVQIFALSGAPAGSTSSYTANGVTINSTTYIPVAGDRLAITLVVAGTGGSTNVRLGPGASGVQTGTTVFSRPQLVQGSVPGDYQVTTSAAAAVQYSDPNGTRTADKLVDNTVNNVHQIFVPYTFVVNGTYGWSIYAKAGERSWLWVNAQDGTDRRTWFDLANGTVGTNAAGNTASITAVGGGWYRCSLNRTTAAANGFFAIGTATADNVATYIGDGTSGIYIWGAQLSNSASVDSYAYNPQAAPTSTAYYGPRFDYNPVTLAANGLLIEQQSTNLLLWSEDFSNAAWSKGATTVTANGAVAPDGATTADKVVEDATTAIHNVGQTVTVVNNTQYTISVYAKAAERNWLSVYEDSGGNNYAFFDLSSGVLGTVNNGTATITPFGNGWYRCTFTHTQTIGTSERVRFGVATSNLVFSYAGNGTSGIFIWGAQLE